MFIYLFFFFDAVKNMSKSTYIFLKNFYRPDTQLKSIVYKLVPGLYQSESKRLQQFNDEHKVTLSDHRQKPASHLNSQLINSKFHTPHQQEPLDSTAESSSRRTDECNDTTYSGDEKIDDVDFFSADEPIRLVCDVEIFYLIFCSMKILTFLLIFDHIFFESFLPHQFCSFILFLSIISQLIARISSRIVKRAFSTIITSNKIPSMPSSCYHSSSTTVLIIKV